MSRSKSSRPEVFCKKGVLEISQNSQEYICARVSFLIKLQKETLAQVFSCEFSEVSKSTFYYKTSLVAASVLGQIQVLKTTLVIATNLKPDHTQSRK